MKRESKVYSYKEQLEEIQLRRELEEKKRKQGKLKEPELTPKQKEILRLQLEKESGIRAKLTQVCISSFSNLFSPLPSVTTIICIEANYQF